MPVLSDFINPDASISLDSKLVVESFSLNFRNVDWDKKMLTFSFWDQTLTWWWCCVWFMLWFQAQVHRHAHNFREVQQCTLLSIKTGGCSEDCSYCPQSSRYSTGVKAQRLMSKDAVIDAAMKVSGFRVKFLFRNVFFWFLRTMYQQEMWVELELARELS